MSRRSTKQQPIEKKSLADEALAEVLRLLGELVRLIGGGHERLAYSVDELVDVVGLSRGFLYLIMDDGRLTARKADGRIMILRSDLIRFLEELPVRPAKNAVGTPPAPVPRDKQDENSASIRMRIAVGL